MFDANFDSKLEKKFEKLKGDKGDALTEAEVAKIKEEIELKVHGSLLDFCQKEIQNYFKVEYTSIQDSTNKSVNLISETFKKYQDELSTHIQSVEELKKQGSETLIKLNSFEIDYDKLIGKIDFEKLKGRDAVVDYKKLLNLIDFSELKGRDGTSHDLDYEFIKKELASLFEEWKANLGDLTGKQGERGEKGNDGLNGFAAAFPWKDTYCNLEGFNGVNFKNYAVTGTPTMFVLDSKGVILKKIATIEQLLTWSEKL